MTIEEVKLVLLNGSLDDVRQALSDFEINSVDKHGSNILHYYIKNQDVIKIAPKDFLEELDKKKFDYDARQTIKFKRTPLALAVFQKKEEIFDLLLDRKVDVDLEDENGKPPLSHAVFKYNNGDDGYFIKKLIAVGANINKKNYHDVSPYDLAHTIADTDVRKFFQ